MNVKFSLCVPGYSNLSIFKSFSGCCGYPRYDLRIRNSFFEKIAMAQTEVFYLLPFLNYRLVELYISLLVDV